MRTPNAIRVETRRRRRLDGAVGSIVITPDDAMAHSGPLIGIASSRLGHDSALHRSVGGFLTRSLLDCRQRGGTMLVAAGSAIEPWAVRASELFSVPLRVLWTNGDDQHHVTRPSDIAVKSCDGKKLARDAVLIALCDRVDAVYVRRGGTIERCLNRRLVDSKDASTRVAVSMTRKCAAPGLIANGAIGWFRSLETTCDGENQGAASPPTNRCDDAWARCDDSWTQTDGQWLIHCTRGCPGAWPNETPRQYRDSILLGTPTSAQRGPLDALTRIIASGRLNAGSITTRRSEPVVCFSAVGLRELLRRRCFRPHLGRWDYEPYGVAIRLEAAKNIGIRPVVYGANEDRETLPKTERYLFHPVGTTYDWTVEREWRSCETVDLSKQKTEDVRVFVNDPADLARLPAYCPWPVTVLSKEAAST